MSPLEALFAEGNRLLAEGDDAAAEARFAEALTIAPDTAELHANLALLASKRGDAPAAEARYRRAIALQPQRLQTRINLAALLMKHKRLAEAEACLAEALDIDEASPDLWSRLGALYAAMRRDDEAGRAFQTALMIAPDHAEARFNASYLLLRQGRFEAGWAALEARDWYAGLAARLPCPRWQGEALQGLSVLVGFEAGHGDMIMFSRFAAALKARGAARVTLLCHPALRRLFASLEAVDRVVAFDEELPADERWDLWTPPLSIPFHLGTRLETLPATLPYLRAEPGLMAHWRPRLPGEGLRVGLVWKGSRGFENDAERSLPSLATLAPLFEVEGISFVSLQKGAGEDEGRNPPAGMTLTHLGTDLRDFADAAAIVAQLDLLVSVDTAMAHLAGALARPCWLLLPDHLTDWRWLDHRDDSPWYPGVMRLFRQPAGGGWSAVVGSLTRMLASIKDRDTCATEDRFRDGIHVSPSPRR